MTTRLNVSGRVAVWGVLLCVVLGGLAAGGCAQQQRAPSAIEVTLVFENVRLVRDGDTGKPPVLDEWGRIKAILATHSARPPTERVLRERAPIGNTYIRDYESSILLGSFATMDDVSAEIKTLADENVAGGGRIEFALAGVEALYRSNYIATAIELFVRGSTTPGATVKLYIGKDIQPEVVVADRRGYFSKKLPALPGDRFIYGESRLEHSPSKFFRIDVLTQRQDALTEDEFRAATGTGGK